MPTLDTARLALACRVFLATAYPGAPASLPANKLPYWDMAHDHAVDAYLTPAPLAVGICHPLGNNGYSFRLGSAHYANLKLKVQWVEADSASSWVFAVDTHDAFSATRMQPPPDHPDAAAWFNLQAANQALKERIETAWEAAGLLTLQRLLRQDLGSEAK
jgi:hypothetical protein